MSRTHLTKPLDRQPLLRRLILPVLARVNIGDITIRHHYTNDKFHLHSFRHRGYWFHGRQREHDVMRGFARLVSVGSTVLDVGGHIGYVSLYLSSLVGDSGRVYVFEPGTNNLPYLSKNVGCKANVVVAPVAVGEVRGLLPLYIENLTGQNNSLVRDFSTLRENEAAAHVRATRSTLDVSVITLDAFVSDRNLHPEFIKVDVEGFEYEVVRGMSALLQAHRPRLMVEVQRNKAEVFQALTNVGYVPFTPSGRRLRDAMELPLNTFFVHAADHVGISKIEDACS